MSDDIVFTYIEAEEKRQREGLELIPSENYVSQDVLRALGSVLTNKYSEGYPGKRYYGGQEWTDKIEQLAIDRAKQLLVLIMQTYSHIVVHRQMKLCIMHGSSQATRYLRWT